MRMAVQLGCLVAPKSRGPYALSEDPTQPHTPPRLPAFIEKGQETEVRLLLQAADIAEVLAAAQASWNR